MSAFALLCFALFCAGLQFNFGWHTDDKTVVVLVTRVAGWAGLASRRGFRLMQ